MSNDILIRKGDVDSNPTPVGSGWDKLSDEEKRNLVDPQKRLDGSEIRERIAYFEAEHKKMAMDAGDERPVVAAFGRDPSGVMRGLGAGEGLNEEGVIMMVDPAKAEAAAEAFKNATPQTVKQKARRSEAMKALCVVALNRVQDPTGGVVHLTLAQCTELHNDYTQAKGEGYKDNDLDFLPMSAYAHKLWPEDRKPLRPMLAKEFGVFQMASDPGSNLAGKIICVSDVQ